MTVLSPLGPFRAFDNNGLPLNGGKLYTYEAGTSTPKTTYTDVTGATPNANPVILDASGYANIWLGSGGYKFILKTSADTTLWTIDNIGGDSENAFGSSIVSTATNLAITSVHQNALIRCTAALTLSLLAAAGAGQGFYFLVKNESSGNVTIDPSGAETIDGAATYVLYPNDSVIVICNGTTWYTSFAVPVAGITTNQISTSGATGVVLKNSAAATVATFGASAATTSVFAGAVTASTTLGVTGIATFSAAANTAKGADIASATTTDIGAATGNFVHITGTTTITGLGTIAAGAIRVVRFAGVLTLTHNATSLILPTGANITTAAGDTAIFISEGSGNWRCVNYEYAADRPYALTLMTPVSASGTFVDFPGIPSWVKRITISLDSVSMNDNLQIAVQIGDSGGIETSGYNGSASFGTSGTSGLSPSTQFIFSSNAGASVLVSGSMVLTLMNSSTNTWAAISSVGYSDASISTVSGGSKSLSGVLDRVRVKTIDGVDVFDAGTISVMYE